MSSTECSGNLYYISYNLSFCYIMYYIVSEIYIGGRFLKDGCYYQQIIKSNRNTKPLLPQHQMPPKTK